MGNIDITDSGIEIRSPYTTIPNYEVVNTFNTLVVRLMGESGFKHKIKSIDDYIDFQAIEANIIYNTNISVIAFSGVIYYLKLLNKLAES